MAQTAPIYLSYRGRELDAQPLSSPPPFGILYVAGALRKAGYPVRVFHLHGLDERPLMDAIRDQRPLFVGVSNFLSPALRPDIAMSRRLRAMGIPVVWGGIFTTCLPEAVLSSDAVDYVVVGEGEVPIVPLANTIAERELPQKIPGVGFRENGEPKIEPPDKPHPHLDDFDFAYDLIDWSQYRYSDEGAGTFAVHVPFSRGCPFRCAFCYNTMNPNRQRWRSHGAAYMKDLLSWLKQNYGVNRVYLLCDNPFGKVSEAQETIEEMKTRWMAVAHLNVVNSDFMDWAVSAGAIRLSFGLESGSERILKMLNKTITPEESLDKLLMCAGKNIFTHSNWMGIIPGESPEDIAATVRLMDTIHRGNKKHVFAFSVFRAFPNTPIWQKCVDLGVPEPRTLDEWGDFNPQINRILGVSDRRALRMKLMMALLFPANRSSDGRLPPLARKVMINRAMKGVYRWPVEDSLSAGYRAYKAVRKVING